MKKTAEEIEVNSDKKENKRRQLLKKVAYTAPVLLALGQLAKPTKAHADSGDPSGPPNWGGF